MDLDYKAVGKRGKIARIKADMTQEQLAELVDVTQPEPDEEGTV